MPHSKKTTEKAAEARRAPRVKFSGTILALVRLESGREIQARLHQLSFTGGLLHLDTPLDDGIKAEVMFHVGGSTIRSKVAVLFPMWATQGCLQPFEFADLGEEDRVKLKADLEKFLTSPAAAVHPDDQAAEAAAGSGE